MGAVAGVFTHIQNAAAMDGEIKDSRRRNSLAYYITKYIRDSNEDVPNFSQIFEEIKKEKEDLNPFKGFYYIILRF